MDGLLYLLRKVNAITMDIPLPELKYIPTLKKRKERRLL